MLAIPFYTATSAAGTGLQEQQSAIAAERSGLRLNDLKYCALNTWIGRVESLNSTELPDGMASLESRNNRLAWLGLQQDGFLARLEKFKSQLGPDRIGVIIGTSTSSIGRTEEAYRQMGEGKIMPPPYCQPKVHNMHSPGWFVSVATGLEGPSMTISTACSSSAKAFASASRWIRHGLVDAVLVGGVDSLCLSTLYGFNSLELTSPEPCRPFDQQRSGISIGEAAAFALLTRPELAPEAEFMLLGYGESSDAYHMSHPHPEARGAILAMEQALQRAGLDGNSVDYVNLHGTASQANDLVETLALSQRLNRHTAASSTKGWTGHTLGAAGMVEAVITLEAMRHGLAPGTLNCTQLDESLHFPVLTENQARPIRVAMSNSFGFGGNNATLVFGAAA